ncbi:hypothetical protein [Desulfovibrio sp. SGI.169]|uniref:hypothetical protein n=1 Tax=Desulfovibrio sp. SGI.169 TaxID=3420561 RepID=UPI003D020283
MDNLPKGGVGRASAQEHAQGTTRGEPEIFYELSPFRNIARCQERGFRHRKNMPPLFMRGIAKKPEQDIIPVMISLIWDGKTKKFITVMKRFFSNRV